MEPGSHINSRLSKLNRLAMLSVSKSDGQGQLAAFRTISQALDSLGTTTMLNRDQVHACVSLLKNLSDLRQHMVKANEISQKEIPQMLPVAHTLNTLFVKTSRHAIRTGNTACITELCEALLQALDDLRGNAGLRTCGILDKQLKAAVGKLRERADIMTLFEGEARVRFETLIQTADQALEDGHLETVSAVYAKLIELNTGLKQKYPLRANLTPYLVKFRDDFLEQIQVRSQALKAEAATSSLFRCADLVQEMESLEALSSGHGETAVARQLRILRNRIMADRIQPLESALDAASDFIRDTTHDHFTIGYQDRYIQVHMEDDLFTPAFYTHTLRDLSAPDALALLQRKEDQISRVSLEIAGQADYESRLKTHLAGLAALFDTGPTPS